MAAASGRTSRLGLSLAELWLSLAVLLPVLGSLIAPMSTVDLAYQVRAGELMLESRSILTTDPFTFTVGGDPWLNQQWGAGVLLGLGYDAVGWAGLAVLRAVLIGVMFGLILVACRAAGAGARTSAVLTLAAFLVSISALGLRAQLFGMVLFAATLAVLGLRTRHPRLLWVLPLLFVAWANLHGSFVIGLAAVGAVLLTDVVARRPMVRQLTVILVACTLATLVNPFGIETWGYALNLATSSQITRFVSEWQPTALRTFPGAAFAASAIAMAGLLTWRGRSIEWPVLAWLAALFIVGLYAERGVAWWALGTAPVAASLLPATALASGATRAVGGREVDVPGPIGHRRSLNLLVAGVVGVAIVAALPTWRGGDALYGPDGLLLDAPRGVTDTLLERATPDDRLFAAQHWGSWFELALPGVPVMVDSRIELFPGEVWVDYLAVTAGREDWREILDGWDVTVVALEAGRGGGVLEFLVKDPGWSLVHEDTEGLVFVRADRPAS